MTCRKCCFCSWVPTIFGKLSFTKLNANKGKVAHFRDSQGEIGAAIGETRATDHPLPWIEHYFLGRDAIYKYILVFEGRGGWGSVGKIKGKLVLFPKNGVGIGGGRLLYAEYNNIGKSIIDKINGCKSVESIDVISFLNKNIDMLLKDVIPSDRNRILYFDFCLYRNGAISIAFEDHVAKSLIPNNCSINEAGEIKRILSIVAYYTIRDTFHAHKHHNARVDNIIGVYPCGNDPENNNECDLWHDDNWIWQVQYSMVRSILELQKRTKYYAALLEAQGIAAYLQSFNTIFIDKNSTSSENLREDSSLRIPLVENLIKSIDFISKKSRYAYEKGTTAVAIIIAIAAFFSSFWASGKTFLSENILKKVGENAVSVEEYIFFSILSFIVVIMYRHEIIYSRIFKFYRYFISNEKLKNILFIILVSLFVLLLLVGKFGGVLG